MKKFVSVADFLCALNATAQTTIDLQGHRGARGLLPENTLPGVALATELGVTTLELDVVATKDGMLVISHDPALDPDITRDSKGNFLETTGPKFIDLSFDELAQFDVGRINPSSRYESACVDRQRPPNDADRA